MPGTKEGARKAREKNLAKDPDFYKKIGQKGGQNSRGGGFAYMAQHDPQRLREVSAKGGSNGRKVRDYEVTETHTSTDV